MLTFNNLHDQFQVSRIFLKVLPLIFLYLLLCEVGLFLQQCLPILNLLLLCVFIFKFCFIIIVIVSLKVVSLTMQISLAKTEHHLEFFFILQDLKKLYSSLRHSSLILFFFKKKSFSSLSYLHKMKSMRFQRDCESFNPVKYLVFLVE